MNDIMVRTWFINLNSETFIHCLSLLSRMGLAQKCANIYTSALHWLPLFWLSRPQNPFWLIIATINSIHVTIHIPKYLPVVPYHWHWPPSSMKVCQCTWPTRLLPDTCRTESTRMVTRLPPPSKHRIHSSRKTAAMKQSNLTECLSKYNGRRILKWYGPP